MSDEQIQEPLPLFERGQRIFNLLREPIKQRTVNPVRLVGRPDQKHGFRMALDPVNFLQELGGKLSGYRVWAAIEIVSDSLKFVDEENRRSGCSGTGKDLFNLLPAVPDPALFDVRGRAPNEGETALRCQYAGGLGFAGTGRPVKKQSLRDGYSTTLGTLRLRAGFRSRSVASPEGCPR